MATSSILSLISIFVFAQLAPLAVGQEVIDVFRWVVPYDGPKTFTANVGDTIVFRWALGGHNVFIHPTMNCNLQGAIAVGFQPGASYTFTEADGSPDGTDMFFACDIGNGSHCRAGQSITVTVFSDEVVEPEIVAVSEDPPTDAPVEDPPTDAPVEDPPTDAPVEDPPTNAPVEDPPTNAPEVEIEASEAPVAAPVAEESEPQSAVITESDSAEATSGSPRVINFFSAMAGLAGIFLALVL